MVGFILGLQLGPSNNRSYGIGIDNQSAIRSLASKLNKLGHYFEAEALKIVAKLRKTKDKKSALTCRWTAEGVDMEAKKVATR